MKNFETAYNEALNLQGYKKVNTDLAWQKFKKEQIEPTTSAKVFSLKSFMRWSSVAAGVALFFTSLYINHESTPQFATYSTGDYQAQVTLVDGSVIKVDKNSSITFPNFYDDLTRREVTVSGNASFDVASNKNLPFTVEKKGLRVDVLGTEFTVSDADSENITIENHEGSVKASDKLDPSISVILEVGDKFLFTPEGFVDLNEPVIVETPAPIISHKKAHSVYKVYEHLVEESRGQIGISYEVKMNPQDVIDADLTQDINTLIQELQESCNLVLEYNPVTKMVTINEFTAKK